MFTSHSKLTVVLMLLTSCSVVLTFDSGCTRTGSKKSSLRDLIGGNLDNDLPLKQLKIKFAFTFIGSGGQKYPVYMTGDVVVHEDLKDATWSSQIDSDGGLVSAVNETKTLKPDRNLGLKSSTNGPHDPNQGITLTSGNPEIGRGLALTLKKVAIADKLTWKAVSLSYFGYDAQIEDSVGTTSAAAIPANQLR